MPASGQSRHFDRGPAPSGLPRSTDMIRPPRHVGLVPWGDMEAFLFSGAVVELGRTPRHCIAFVEVSLHALPDELDSLKQSETLRFGLLAAALALVQPQLDLLHQTDADVAGDLRRGGGGRGRAGIA